MSGVLEARCALSHRHPSSDFAGAQDFAGPPRKNVHDSQTSFCL
jgi:hypothetical protein